MQTEALTISPLRQLLPATHQSQRKRITVRGQHVVNTFLITAGANVAYQYVFIGQTPNPTEVALLVHRRRGAVVGRDQFIVYAGHGGVRRNDTGPLFIHTQIVVTGRTQRLRNALFCRTTNISIGATYTWSSHPAQTGELLLCSHKLHTNKNKRQKTLYFHISFMESLFEKYVDITSLTCEAKR